ncbi:MAG: PAS domain S-box protein [Rhodospirillaceae bacterium]|nr:PAS domain S-box protein [Rhodospirillaceae bacterium]
MTIRTLVIEDSTADAELILRELRRAGYDLDHRRIESEEALNAALDERDWDLVLGDHSLPRLGGTRALEVVRGRGLSIPFIFVSDTAGEDVVVSAMRAGAQDFVVKDRLERLVPAVRRELQEAAQRRARMPPEAGRQAGETRFRAFLMAAPDAIIVTDADRRITVFNRAAEAIFGYAAAEVLGRPIGEVLPQGLLAGPHGESVARRKNGEAFPVEASVAALEEGGKPAYMAIVRDISGRKRADEKLRQFSRAVEQSASLVVVTDANGVIQYANSRLLQATGYSAEEVIGKRPSLWRSPRTPDAQYEQLWKTILSGEDWRGEFENRRKDGTPMIVSATISPVRDESGRITHFIGIEEDITQRREIEAQLRQSQKLEAIGQLTGGLAHDFNNLLSVIVGNLDILQEQLPPEGKPRELVDMALRGALRGAELTRRLLAFARRQPLMPRLFDINALVGQTSVMLRRMLGETLDVVVNLADDVWPVNADPSQVEAALTNLAINARDAMPKGGTLLIETGNRHLDEDYAADNPDVRPGDYVMLAVSDSGTGIPPEILPRVCEPFFTTKPSGQGTGLGLSMVYGFVRQSGGHLKIYSEVGHGTTVRLYLPRAGERRPAAAEAVVAREAAAPGVTILVVEDNDDVRGLVVKQLGDLGYAVRAAANAAAALEILEKEPGIDLLFTDIIMPGGMLGTDLAREVRRRWPAVKILLTTGFSEAAASIQPGSLPIISKPYRKHTLAAKLREVLGR